MATTEGGRELSESFEKLSLTQWSKFIADHGSFVCFPTIYKLKKGVLHSVYFKFVYPNGIERHCLEDGTEVREYLSTLADTKIHKAIDRAYTNIMGRYRKLIRDGWYEIESEASEAAETEGTMALYAKPMLFKHYKDYKSSMDFPCIAQIKVDGYRATWIPGLGLKSRGGKLYELPHIVEAMPDEYIIDGEVAYDNVRPLQEVTEGISKKDEELKFYAFDCLHSGTVDNRVYKERLANLLSLREFFDGGPVRIVPTIITKNHTEIDVFYSNAVSEGYEGVMVKSMSSVFLWGKRVSNILKYKQEFELPCRVETIDVDKGPDGEDLISFIMRLEKDDKVVYFKCTPAWTHEERRLMYTSATLRPMLIGMEFTVECRGFTKKGIPIHAVIKTTYKETMDTLRERVAAILDDIKK